MEYRIAAFFLVGGNFAVMKFQNQTVNTQKGSISAERHNRLSSAEKEKSKWSGRSLSRKRFLQIKGSTQISNCLCGIGILPHRLQNFLIRKQFKATNPLTPLQMAASALAVP